MHALILALFTAACRDARDACYLWSTVGECESNQEYMSANCAASCGLCEEDELHQQVAVAAGGTAAPPDMSALLRGSGDASIVLVRKMVAEIELLPLGIVPPDRIVALKAGELHLVMLTANGAVITWDDERMEPRVDRCHRTTRHCGAPGRIVAAANACRCVAIGIGAGTCTLPPCCTEARDDVGRQQPLAVRRAL